MQNPDLKNQWSDLLERLRIELEALSTAEKDWLLQQVEQIEALQRQLHSFFELAAGDDICRDCRGACCAKGLHHLTLANLLTFLLRDETLPPPDFSSTCPLLGSTGCLWPAERRPFNCVTFICEAIEARLSRQEIDRFYALEKELRALYLNLDARYLGSSLRGIWIAASRTGGENFLKRR